MKKTKKCESSKAHQDEVSKALEKYRSESGIDFVELGKLLEVSAARAVELCHGTGEEILLFERSKIGELLKDEFYADVVALVLAGIGNGNIYKAQSFIMDISDKIKEMRSVKSLRKKQQALRVIDSAYCNFKEKIKQSCRKHREQESALELIAAAARFCLEEHEDNGRNMPKISVRCDECYGMGCEKCDKLGIIPCDSDALLPNSPDGVSKALLLQHQGDGETDFVRLAKQLDTTPERACELCLGTGAARSIQELCKISRLFSPEMPPDIFEIFAHIGDGNPAKGRGVVQAIAAHLVRARNSHVKPKKHSSFKKLKKMKHKKNLECQKNDMLEVIAAILLLWFEKQK